MPRNGAEHVMHLVYNANGVPAWNAHQLLAAMSGENPPVHFAPLRRYQLRTGQTRPAVTAPKKHSSYDKELARNSMREAERRFRTLPTGERESLNQKTLNRKRSQHVFFQKQNNLCCEKNHYATSNGTCVGPSLWLNSFVLAS